MNQLQNLYEWILNLWQLSLKKGFIHLLLSNYAMKVFGFASQIFVAWILSPTDIGRIKIWQSYLAIASIITVFGFNSSTLKLCSENRPDEEKYDIYRQGLIYSILPLFLTYLLIGILSYFRLISPDIITNNYFWVFAIGLIPITYNSLQLSYLQAIKKIREYATAQLISKVTGIFIIIGFTYFFYLKGYLIALIIGYCFTSVLLYAIIKKSRSIAKKKSENSFRLHIRYAFPSTFTNLINTVAQNADILILNYLTFSRLEVGYYSFAIVLLGFLRILSTSMIQYTTPNLSLHSDNFIHWYSLFKSYEKKWLVSCFIIFVLALMLIIPLLKFGISGKYSHSSIFFIILATAWLVRTITVIQGNALFSIGMIKLNTILSAFYLVINVSAQFLFIKIFGVLGAAIGLLLSEIINTIAGVWIFRNYINKMQKKSSD